eukprot:3865297-Rhodomonas_salina.2
MLPLPCPFSPLSFSPHLLLQPCKVVSRPLELHSHLIPHTLRAVQCWISAKSNARTDVFGTKCTGAVLFSGFISPRTSPTNCETESFCSADIPRPGSSIPNVSTGHRVAKPEDDRRCDPSLGSLAW